MIRFLTDEDFDGRIVRGLRRNFPEIDVLRIQDAGLRTFHNRFILDNAAELAAFSYPTTSAQCTHKRSSGSVNRFRCPA